MSVRLFVGNLPYDATEEDIRAHFATAGNLTSVFLPVDRETGRKRGFGFVEFSDAAAAQEAIRLFNNQPFKGRALAVNEARAKEPGSRPAPTGGYRSGPSAGGRPSAPMGRPSGPSLHRSPPPEFMPEPGADRGGRADRTRKFGPDAKPARVRAQRFKGPDGGKKAFKEKLGGQIFGDVNDEEDFGQEPEIDNFAIGVDETESDQ
jgi:RNA recognition motif-containing protein